MGGWKLYGGPFFYMFNGDFDLKETNSGGEVSSWWKGKADVEEDSSFGGYIGAKFDLSQNTAMTVEFSAISDGWGLGTGITFKF
jgi:hypothetical protein